jgi:uncharacterized membrane protein
MQYSSVPDYVIGVLLPTSPARRRACAIVLQVVSGYAAYPGSAAAQPHVLKWDIQATVYFIADPHNVFPDVRLGDNVHGTLTYNLNSVFYDFGHAGSGVYVHGPTFPATEMVIENPRTGVDLVFKIDETMAESDVFVLNNWQDFGWPERADQIRTSQPVLLPVPVPDETGGGFQQPTVEVRFTGPVGTITDGELPLALNLDDWPVADMAFYDNWIYDTSDTWIDASIYSLIPVPLPVVPGDFDADADADARDYAIWRTQFGGTEYLDADASGNGTTDAADYVLWRENVDPIAMSATAVSGSSSGYNGNVPEPTTNIAAAFALLLCGARRRGFSKTVGRRSPPLRVSSLLTPLLFITLASANAARAEQPFFMGLTLTGQTRSQASDISPDGSVVVGTSLQPTGERIFRWTEQSGIVDLNSPLTQIGDVPFLSRSGTAVFVTSGYFTGNYWRWTPDTEWTALPKFDIGSATAGPHGPLQNAVSYDGRVAAGIYEDKVLRYFPGAYWSATNGLQDLGDFPGRRINTKESRPNGISADGRVVVGWGFDAFGPSGTERAFRWTPTTGFSLMGLDSLATSTSAVSADGSVVVGVVGKNPIGLAHGLWNAASIFRWTELSGAEVLTNPPGTIQPTGQATLVSQDGSTIVALFDLETSGWGYFRWKVGSGWKPLGIEFSEPPGAGMGLSMSHDGSVISSPVIGGEPVIWDEANGTRPLRDVLVEARLGPSVARWSRLFSASLSADGRTMAGTGRNPQGNIEAWVAYLGSPVPEPGALTLAAVAMLPFAFRRRRQRNPAIAQALQRNSRWLLPTVLIAIVGRDSASAQQPFFMGLGDLPGGPFFSWATDVSYDGFIVTGWSFRGDYPSPTGTDAFRWTRETGMIGLGAIGEYFNDIRISTDGSTIVGNIGDGPAFRWTMATGVTTFPPAEVWIANGVNGDGSIIVGQARQFHPNLQAIKWTESGDVEPLFAGFSNTWAFDISADGSVILGRRGGRNDDGGTLLINSALEGITFIEGGPTLFGEPEISDNGKVVVGSFSTGEFDNGQPFRWTKETGVVYLGPLPDGKRTVSVRGVSADGSIIVGNSEVDVDNIIHLAGGVVAAREPFIWDAAHGPRYLFDMLKTEYGLSDALAGWGRLGNVYAVSGDGRTIVGLGVNPDGNGEAWIAYLGPPTAQLPGDYNANGTVDAADYVIWRNNGSAEQEYETWRANFGLSGANSSTASAGARNSIDAAVPEPGAVTLFLLGFLAALATGRSRWRVARDPGYTVEVSVVARQVGQTISLHHGCDQCVSGKQFVLSAQRRRRENCVESHVRHVNADPRYLPNGLLKHRKQRNLRMVLSQSSTEPCRRPTELLHRLDRHHAMCHVGDNFRRSVSLQVPLLDSLDQPGTGCSVGRFTCKVIDQYVGVEKYIRTGGDLVEHHGDSRMSNSGSSAKRRSVSGSPVHRSIPADCRARLIVERITTCTFSCSASGNGDKGLSTPPSYVASIESSIIYSTGSVAEHDIATSVIVPHNRRVTKRQRNEFCPTAFYSFNAPFVFRHRRRRNPAIAQALQRSWRWLLR